MMKVLGFAYALRRFLIPTPYNEDGDRVVVMRL
jgi:hypothetical protein